MLPKDHILLGYIFAVIIYLLFPITLLQASIIFLASFLIDFDHYVFYVFRKKDFSLKRAYNYLKLNGEKKKRKPAMMFFHTVECLFLIILLSYFFNFFRFVLIGMIFHMSLDYKSKREYSILRYLIIRKRRPNYYF